MWLVSYSHRFFSPNSMWFKKQNEKRKKWKNINKSSQSILTYVHTHRDCKWPNGHIRNVIVSIFFSISSLFHRYILEPYLDKQNFNKTNNVTFMNNINCTLTEWCVCECMSNFNSICKHEIPAKKKNLAKIIISTGLINDYRCFLSFFYLCKKQKMRTRL